MISVIMGVYNNEKTVEKSVQSILNGSFSDIEFIIADDGSTDKTSTILQTLAQKDTRIKLLKNEQNKGLTYSLNRCLEVAQGNYIARQDADDVSEPDRLEIQIDFLKSHPEYDFCGTAAKLVDENGRVWGTRFFPEKITKNILVKYCPFIHPTMLFKTSSIKAVNGYKDTKHTLRCEDYDLYFRLYAAGFKGANISKMLLMYYENPDSFYRHTKRTRLNEAYVRRHGSCKIHKPISGFIYSLKPIVLSLIPKKIYNNLHNNKWKN